MPPQESPHAPIEKPDHLLPEHTKSSGPLFGTAIIIILLLIGAFYFWGAELNRRNSMDQLPLIPDGDVTARPSV